MTTEIHVTSTSNVYLNKQKNFCFCILRIVIFTSSKVKCNFNQNPFKNSIKKIHQKSAFFKKLKCITKVKLYGKGVLT